MRAAVVRLCFRASRTARVELSSGIPRESLSLAGIGPQLNRCGFTQTQIGVLQRGWRFIDGRWYHLDNESGAMNTGWFLDDDGTWYYLMSSGQMVNGWNRIGDSEYFFNASGAWVEPEHSARASLQSQIVNRCHSVPSPGAGLCSEWVSHVFTRAGVISQRRRMRHVLELVLQPRYISA